MKFESKKTLNLLLRYALLILIAFFGLNLFYTVFLPLTKYSVYYFLQIFFEPIMVGDTLQFGQKTIEIIGACVAGSAYSFLLLLNLGTPNIKLPLRMKMILFSFGIFLIVNIARIIILSLMYLNDSPSFDALHKILWYFGSTILVVLIWFLQIKIFEIEKIPFYSDLKSLYQKSNLKKK